MSANYRQALAGAVIARDAEGVNHAIERGADPDALTHGTRPLHIAVITGSSEMTSLLLRNGAHPDSRDHVGRTALHYAAMGAPDSGLSALRTLLDAKADVNARDARGCTPLDLAAGAGNEDAARALHNAGGVCKADRSHWVQQASGRAPSGAPSR